ncbi:hypothetical protein MN608_08756 [Microdochium nivale]|nr:hypothetical protein MN608_08756 [Microdochium nivale]
MQARPSMHFSSTCTPPCFRLFSSVSSTPRKTPPPLPSSSPPPPLPTPSVSLRYLDDHQHVLPPAAPAPPRPRPCTTAASPGRLGAAAPPAPTAQGIKRIIWTGAFAAVTFVGAIYGAGLKTQQDYKAEKTKIIEATPEDRIAQLQARRSTLVSQRIPVQRKLDDLHARMRAADEKEKEKEKRK